MRRGILFLGFAVAATALAFAALLYGPALLFQDAVENDPGFQSAIETAVARGTATAFPNLTCPCGRRDSPSVGNFSLTLVSAGPPI
jgi:hypothetical protein